MVILSALSPVCLLPWQCCNDDDRDGDDVDNDEDNGEDGFGEVEVRGRDSGEEAGTLTDG